jgi:hypothetical protein
MKNCPVCGIPVEEDNAQCSYCGANMNGVADVETSAPVEANPVPIATFTSMVEAEACKSKLEAAGLAAMVDSGAAGDGGQFASGPRQIQLWVRDSDAEKAMAILSGDGPPPSAEGVVETHDHHHEGEATSDEYARLGELHAAEVSAEPPTTAHAPVEEVVVPVHSVRTLESKLSALMDDHDTPGWTVNPAMHPDVLAFIEEHSHNREFMKRAKALQENRASYYATMRAKEGGVSAAAAEEEDQPEAVEAGDLPNMDNIPDVADLPSTTSVPITAPKPARAYLAGGAPRRRRRLLPTMLLLLVVPAAVVVGTSMYYRQQGEKKLEEATTAATAKGPIGWDDLKTKRAEVPEAANTAPQVEAVAKLLADKQVAPPVTAADLLKLEPKAPIEPDQLKALRAESRKALRPLVSALKLDPRPDKDGKFPTGRYPDRSIDELLTNKPAFLDSAGKVVDVLLVEAALNAQQDQRDNAIANARRALAVARSVGDDPDPAAQKFRINCRRWVAQSIERTLALSVPANNNEALTWKMELRKTQALLEEEVNQPLLTYAMRGKRAVVNEALNRLDANASTVPTEARSLIFHLTSGDGPLASAEHFLKLGWIMENHARSLDLMTTLVDLSELPEAQQLAKFREVEQAVNELEGSSSTALARHMVTDAVTLVRDYFVSRAELRLAIAGIAAERFQLQSGRWPKSIEELATARGKLLTSPTVDPFDGQSLRIKAFDGGIMIYSVGPDGKDNEGHYDRAEPAKADNDLVFRLWDPAKRKQK